MIVPDLNLLVYTFNASAQQHDNAVTWWEGLLNSSSFVGIPWTVYLGFLRLMTGRHILVRPYSCEEVADIVSKWFSIHTVSLLRPSEKTRQILEKLIVEHQLSGGIVSDAVIAALAIEHDATIHSNDTDFARFNDLRTHNPLR